MVDRLRALLDHPLEPSAARAVLVFSSAILLGLATLFILAASQPDVDGEARPNLPTSTAPGLAEPRESVVEPDQGPRGATPETQDPQDVPGSPAARRAARALQSHRALQSIPYRSGGVAIDLVGARGHRAVLRVRAETVRAARHGWRQFLRRHHDSGGAYLPIFRTRKRGGNV